MFRARLSNASIKSKRGDATLGKLPEHAPRLGEVLAMFANSDAKEIIIESMGAASDWPGT
jgi:hypothetical protein